jgi:hypothetical protein
MSETKEVKCECKIIWKPPSRKKQNFCFFDINFKLPKLTIFRKDIKLFLKILNYLGVLLSKSGNFSMAKKAQVEKATKAMFEVLKR